jgi:hypothetical protein
VAGGTIGTIMAANINDPTQGFFYGTPMQLPQQTLTGFEFGGIATGDFDGDGANEIAVSYLGPCPPPCFGNPIVVAIFKPNVTTDAQGNVTALTLVLAGSVTIQPGAITGTTLTAGKYLGTPSSQLALIYSGAPDTPTTVLPPPISSPIATISGSTGACFTSRRKRALSHPTPGRRGLDVRPIDVSASRAFLGDKVIISGLVHAADAADGLSVLFRDGTPTSKGTLFDVEPISHIRADGAHLVKTVYRPSTCGTHVLSLQVMNTAAAGQATIEVTVDALRAIED